eukprot:Tbor_TRINITY_DN5306_c2_g1::TRINITY_DN5306_c2_g1_i2::g.4365::m.4365/K14309/NUP93, NIC96; nuclear pore complex protein Nup93
MTSSENNIGSIRANIARLEANARHLLTVSDNRVVRNGRSVFEASRKILEEVGQNIGPAGENQASTELFLANVVGFNLQEQQRLLRQIVANRPTVFPTNPMNTVFPSTADEEASGSALDLEGYLANRRNDALQRAVEEVHQNIEVQQRNISEAFINDLYEQRTNEIAEMLGMESLQLLESSGKDKNLEGCSSVLLGGSSSNYKTIAERMEGKICAFANVVSTVAVPDWGEAFTSIALEAANTDVSDPMVTLWSTAQGIASFALEGGNAGHLEADTKAATIGCSRAVLEEGFLMNIFQSVLNVDACHFEELSRMHPSKMKGVIATYCSDKPNHIWYHVYISMRAGCYSTAHLIASEAGLSKLASAIQTIALLPPKKRNSAEAKADVSSLWKEEDTRDDAYRCAVLVILSGGCFSATDEAALQLVGTLAERLSKTIEDILWLRLTLIRNISRGPSIHSLTELQRMILGDQQAVLSALNGDPIKYASLLLHVMLPSTAVRVLLDTERTFVDAVHLGILFDTVNMIQTTELEAAVGIPHLLRRYCSILLEVPRRGSRILHPAHAIFSYFSMTDHIQQGFLPFCQSNSVLLRLFGPIADSKAREGELLHSDSPPKELLDAMELVAKSAIDNGKTHVALHVLIVLERTAALVRDEDRGCAALRTAIQAICPAMSHNIHIIDTARDTTTLEMAHALHECLLSSVHDVPVSEIDNFRCLRVILVAYHLAYDGDQSGALRTVYSLPFLPSRPLDVDSSSRKYVEMVTSDDVLTVMPMFAVLVMKLLVWAYGVEGAGRPKEEIRAKAHALVMFVMKWRNKPSREVMETLSSAQRGMIW